MNKTLWFTIATCAAIVGVLGFAKQSQAMDYRIELKMKEFVEDTAGLIYIAHACKLDDRFLVTDVIFNRAYELYAGADIYDRQLVDMEYKLQELEWMETVNVIKDNPNHPEIVEACNIAKEETSNILDLAMGKA